LSDDEIMSASSRPPPKRPPRFDLTECAPSALQPSRAAPNSDSNVDWSGTDRYRVVRRLGEGAMGAVYEALDREGGRAVALKRLLYYSPEALYRFKREFRTLADVYHPNLVRLYELIISENDRPCFAMELVRGVDFVEHVRGHLPEGTAPNDMDRLRRVLRQLVEGVQALHAAGRLHRDLKPSNVMVAHDGRVVVLDFGIATELATEADVKRSDAANLVGTLAYMAPEQGLGRALGPACDWYGVGVILYEALVGRVPFVDHPLKILLKKAKVDPAAPSATVTGIPPDLDTLCRALIDRDPERRPTAPDILRRLGVGRSWRRLPSLVPPANRSRFVGREEELRALRSAFDAVRSGQTVTVTVGGGSGIGKSALVQRFLDDLQASRAAEILSGRAYERESVPYKAVDSLVDSLTRLLIRIEKKERPVATPRHASALARLFPVLKRVPSLADLRDVPVEDSHDVRREAFGALRELVSTLATRQPLVLYIDDVQWGDVDSVALLHEIMRPPQAPPVLLLMTYREEEAGTSPFLREMKERWAGTADVRDVRVGPLDLEDAQRLALVRIGASDELSTKMAHAVAREAKGSPILVKELVRGNQMYMKDARLSRLTLAEIVGDRLERLSKGARHFAEVVAIAGRPLPLPVLAGACGDVDASHDHVELLLRERLVRVRFLEGSDVIEASHDRVRETIVEHIPASHQRTHHRDLARALEAASSVDLEALAVHLIGSGAHERGAVIAERAAEQAESKLAFDQAARLYRVALETHPHTESEARAIRIRLAKALERSGRGAEAARAYREAAVGASPLERVDLERQAAEQLLFSGRTDEGTQALHRVLAAVGMKAPRTALGAILSLLLNRFLLRLRGLKFEERSPDQVSAEDLVRLRALRAVAVGFSFVDVILGYCMQARLFRMALDVGDRRQVAVTAALQFAHLASQGGAIGKAERGAYSISERLAATLGDKDAESAFQACRGIALFHRGRFGEARDVLYSHAATSADSLRIHHGPLSGVYSLMFLGRLREGTRRATQLLDDAERRGDLYTAVNLRAAPLVDVCLFADDPDAAREHIRIALATWTQRGFHLQHWKAMVWGTQIELYVGDGARAYARLEQDRRAYRRSLMDRAQPARALTAFIRGRAAVASALNAPAAIRRSRLREARRVARSLEREGMAWTAPLASMVRAATANAEGDARGAAAALRVAIECAAANEMNLHLWSARRQLGCLLGGEEGERYVAQADAAMQAEGVRAPARMATMFVPGRWEGSGSPL
jgi:serine/threonine protein kinase